MKLARTELVRPALLREVRVHGFVTFERAREIVISRTRESGPERVRWTLAGMVGNRLLAKKGDVWTLPS